MPAKRDSWLVQLAIATIPALVTGFFSYQTAVASARGTTTERTDKTYDTLAAHLNRLDGSLRETRQQLNQVQKHIQEIERRLAGPPLQTPALRPLEVGEPIRLPVTLEEAIKQKQRD
ncbi:MAG TPA: hypothetical protein VKN99_28520 [Polyangia bacterium]|nr:hypothetical protein [Polyangia bacterium]